MLEIWESEDPFDARLATGASGLLRTFNEAGVLTAADVHVAARTADLAGEPSEEVRLAVAMAVRAVRLGSVCVDLAMLTADAPELPWPQGDWLGAVAVSPMAQSVVRIDGPLLYLDRYHREEVQVRDDLVARLGPMAASPGDLDERAAQLADVSDDQRAAALAAVHHRTTVLIGGPGTGKTHTVGKILELLGPQRVALTAPTGKAAARLQESVGSHEALTLHRLLGWRPGSRTRFKHHRGNKLPHDVVVVDETSMVSLTMMARLLEAVRPEARLILVGDADQLASVEAGALLADLVGGLGDRAVARLTQTHRFKTGGLGDLAAAIREGDADRAVALLEAGGDVAFAEADELEGELVGHARAVQERALAGDGLGALAAADEHRLLCAHRDGPWGASHWNRQIERWIEAPWTEWYAGRPVLITANDYGLRLFNGDTGVTIETPEGPRVVIAGGAAGPSSYPPSRLGDVETLHAMTVHKSQGSQARAVSVLLPPEDSPLLSRELFYTAVTRAQERVRVVGSPDAVRVAIERRALRASGLVERLRRSAETAS